MAHNWELLRLKYTILKDFASAVANTVLNYTTRKSTFRYFFSINRATVAQLWSTPGLGINLIVSITYKGRKI